MAGFEDAVQELSQVPLPQFVDERKRLAGELKSAGDAAGAKQLLARKRPTISAWVVNQLYWHARDAFEDLMATAERLRKGDLKASAAHRDAIAKLRGRAKTVMEDAGNAPTESTLRRVATTLAAIAVAGGFDPDPPGALAEDRDPPGFAAFGIAGDEPAAAPAPKPRAAKAKANAAKKPANNDDGDGAKKHAKDDDGKHDNDGDGHPIERAKADDDDDGVPAQSKHAQNDNHADELAKARAKREREAEERESATAEKDAEKARAAEEAAQHAAAMAEKKREEAEQKRSAAERHRLEAEIRAAKAELADRLTEVKQLEKQLAAATKSVESAREVVDDLVRKRDELHDPD